MIKVYQKIVDRGHGDCMRAVIASMFEKELEEVPHFREYKDGWFEPLLNFIEPFGYTYDGCLFNRKHSRLCTPTEECFNEIKFHERVILSPKRLYEEKGVNGYFFASVLSPKYFHFGTGFTATHAVVIDRDYNVVHDPNPNYKDLRNYPLSSILDYNGIIDVMLINPVSQ